jgi:hypothetical protein
MTEAYDEKPESGKWKPGEVKKNTEMRKRGKAELSAFGLRISTFQKFSVSAFFSR